jgi:YfiH family protein
MMPRPILADNLSALSGISHGFFTRKGGVSSGLYAELNCGLGSQDDPAAVRENRARVVAWLGAERLATAYQTHGTVTVVAENAWPADRRPRADAIVTRTPGLAIGVLTADCTPVLLADAEARVVGAVHVGWRGALCGILESALAAMTGIGAVPARTHAAVGPAIGQAVYEVGPEFRSQFLARDPGSAPFFFLPCPDARPHFDLPGYIANRLRQTGLAAVETRAPCTYSGESDFFSYRRSRARGETDHGRQISAIVLT